MWTRKELKDRAKEVLRLNYWKAFGISILIAIAGGSGGGSSGGGEGSSRYADPSGPFFVDTRFWTWLITFWVIAAIISTFVLAFRIFVGYPLEVGGRKWFIQSAQHFDNSNCFGYAFSGRNYLRIVLTMLLKGIFNFLWFLLFFFPGIVKYYAYSMVPYILADDPNLGYADAIRLSNQMTRGHKFDMFVLDLSFIGWYLLGALALGIGVLFVMPYENSTKAELYIVLRNSQPYNSFNNSQWAD